MASLGLIDLESDVRDSRKRKNKKRERESRLDSIEG